MKLSHISEDGFHHIVRNMREWDRREVYAVSWATDPQTLGDQMFANLGSFAFMASADDGEPVAAIGALNAWPGLWTPWAIGTDRFPLIARQLTRFVRNDMIPLMRDLGFRRAECFSMVGHAESHKWLAACGGTPEYTAKSYGKNGEDFVLYAWYNNGQTGQ